MSALFGNFMVTFQAYEIGGETRLFQVRVEVGEEYEYAEAQRRFIEEAIREKLERERAGEK